jgi:hypothetical protein
MPNYEWKYSPENTIPLSLYLHTHLPHDFSHHQVMLSLLDKLEQCLVDSQLQKGTVSFLPVLWATFSLGTSQTQSQVYYCEPNLHCNLYKPNKYVFLLWFFTFSWSEAPLPPALLPPPLPPPPPPPPLTGDMVGPLTGRGPSVAGMPGWGWRGAATGMGTAPVQIITDMMRSATLITCATWWTLLLHQATLLFACHLYANSEITSSSSNLCH